MFKKFIDFWKIKHQKSAELFIDFFKTTSIIGVSVPLFQGVATENFIYTTKHSFMLFVAIIFMVLAFWLTKLTFKE